jgi:hypothetical protein
MKSELYELIQKSQNDEYGKFNLPKLFRPEFTYNDDFDQKTNIHSIQCYANISINGNIEKYMSNIFPNKKDANKDVCIKIYTDLLKNINDNDKIIKKNSSKSKVNSKLKIEKDLLILIDYENVSEVKQLKKLDTFLSDIDTNVEIIKFAGHASSMKNSADIVVKSTRSDAVDHYISFYLGQQIGLNRNILNSHSVHILSRDKFASCLEDFCDAVIHNVDVDHLIESIQVLGT